MLLYVIEIDQIAASKISSHLFTSENRVPWRRVALALNARNGGRSGWAAEGRQSYLLLPSERILVIMILNVSYPRCATFLFLVTYSL